MPFICQVRKLTKALFRLYCTGMAKQSFGFALTFLALFALSFLFLARVDALPEPIDSTEETPVEQVSTPSTNVTSPELPLRIVADAIGLDKPVANPTSGEIDIVDAALLGGTARYPESAMLGVDGTVLVVGHSSYLPIVKNKNYKAFNGIQNLKQGAVISVYSATTEYRYTVTGVRLASGGGYVVELPSNGKFLTLVTCDTKGSKADRFVVTAEFEGAYALN